MPTTLGYLLVDTATSLKRMYLALGTCSFGFIWHHLTSICFWCLHSCTWYQDFSWGFFNGISVLSGMWGLSGAWVLPFTFFPGGYIWVLIWHLVTGVSPCVYVFLHLLGLSAGIWRYQVGSCFIGYGHLTHMYLVSEVSPSI